MSKQRKSKPVKKYRKKAKTKFATFAALVTAIIAAILSIMQIRELLINHPLGGKSKEAVIISYSEWLPYWESGYGGVYEEESLNESDYYNNEYEQDEISAVAIRSFIENPNEKAVRIERISTEILDLETREDEIILVDAAMKGNTLCAYAANNGWGDSKEHTIEFTFMAIDGPNRWEERPLSDIGYERLLDSSLKLSSGEIKKIAEYDIDYEQFIEKGGFLAIHYFLDGSLINLDYFLNYDDENGFFLETAGSLEEHEPCSASLFAVLDVEKQQTSIRYTSLKAVPEISGTYLIETVLAPSKSCNIRCKNVFRISGREYETDEMYISVSVPYYSDFHGLVNYLIKSERQSESSIREAAKKYRFNPETINGSA